MTNKPIPVLSGDTTPMIPNRDELLAQARAWIGGTRGSAGRSGRLIEQFIALVEATPVSTVKESR